MTANLLNKFRPFSSVADDVYHADERAGAYEWWYFDALSDDGRDCLVVIFLIGFIFSPDYNRAVDNYLSDNGQPSPRPSDYPALAVTLYRDGRPLYRAINQFTAPDFYADTKKTACRIGDSRFYLDETRYVLELDAVLRGGKRLMGSFVWEVVQSSKFKVQSSKLQVQSPDSPESKHSWNLVAPRCRVSGELRVNGARVLNFNGNGYHDHNHDSRWLPATVAAWEWGRAHFAGETTAIYYRYREHGAEEANCYLFLDTKEGLQTYPARLIEARPKRHHFGLRYPRELTVETENARLEITQRRVIDGSFFYLRCQDVATLEFNDGAKHSALAVTEQLAPQALRYRWLDWLVKMRIGRKGRGAFLP